MREPSVARGSVRYGIVLAGGSGRRLESYIARLRGEALPKQYVNFIGRRSMLEHTFARAERLIPPERLFTVASREHLFYPEAERQLASRPRGTVILQPENKETAPGLLLPLMHLHARYPDAIVAVFPADHFIVEEALFMAHVDLACRAVERDPSRVVMLGIAPDDPEPEYGYILPGGEWRSGMPAGLRRVARFIEKPAPPAAREIVRRGGLWNTMVMAFRTTTLLDVARRIAPALHRSFQRIGQAIGTPHESRVVDETYRQIGPMNFSRGLLEVLSQQQPSRLSVLAVRGVFWSDWGSEERILSALRQAGHATQLQSLTARAAFAVDARRVCVGTC